jgi:PAS domain S-box-containing protein
MADSGVATILVVDDNPATLYSTGRFLRAAGFNVREATTGQEALDLAQEGPHAIVLDVNLPDLDGFEVCRILRNREGTARTPIIHLSATFVGTHYTVQGLDSGADGYLTHPVEPPVLIATLNAFLRARTAEVNMGRSERKFRAIFDQAVNGIALLSSELVYLEVNPSLCRILGRDRSEIIGKPLTAFGPSTLEKREDAISSELECLGTWSGTFPLMRPEGSLVELSWHISLHTSPSLRLAEVTDITERIAAERERECLLANERAARSEAEHANRVKDEFLAMISHELRSPLNAIVGWANYLKMAKSTDIRDYAKGIDAIDRNATAQERLIADLLDVSSITTGKMRLDLKPVDIAEVARNSIDGQFGSAESKSITIETAIDTRPAHIPGDFGRLHQIMSNLLVNAIKFTPVGGRILIRLERQPSHVEISVIDNGQGISEDFLPYIFDTFRQEHSGTTRAHGGLGLGLAIAKRLVEMHGGTISAHSEGRDKGSTFIVRFPLDSVHSEIAESDLHDGSPFRADILRGVRVLVVDDNADACVLTSRILKDYSALVFTAASVTEAIPLLKSFAPGILVGDIGMPGDDGYELIRQVRGSGYEADRLPAIALTAFTRIEDQNRILESGYQTYLAKPVDPSALIHAITSLLSGISGSERVTSRGQG